MAGANYGKRVRPRRFEPDNPAQYEKFLESAKGLGLDTDGRAFQELIRLVFKSPKSRKAYKK